MSFRVLIVDDEAPARRKIRSLLAGDPELTIAGEAASGSEAVEAIHRMQPDLVFLDIQMPGMDGFQVISNVGTDAMPAVIIVTAFDEYALHAFEVEAIDYLLKPVREDRFGRALQRARQRIESRESGSGRLNRLLQRVRPAARYLQRIVVREGDRMFFLSTNQIVRISAEGNYVRLHTAEGTHMLREPMSHLEAQLDPEQFVRIHRSEIVRIDCVKEVQLWFHGDHIVVLQNGEKCHLSRRYKSRLLPEHAH